MALRNKNPRKKLPILCQNFGREVLNLEDSYSKISHKSSESKHLLNQEESGTGLGEINSEISAPISSASNTRENEKEITLSKSDKTTINSHFEEATREKMSNVKYPKKKKVIKNNGKFVLSKKSFKLGSKEEYFKEIVKSEEKKSTTAERSSHIDLSNK